MAQNNNQTNDNNLSNEELLCRLQKQLNMPPLMMGSNPLINLSLGYYLDIFHERFVAPSDEYKELCVRLKKNEISESGFEMEKLDITECKLIESGIYKEE